LNQPPYKNAQPLLSRCDMTVNNAQPESLDSTRSTDTVFTEWIVGTPFCLTLGRLLPDQAKHGLEYSPKIGVRLTQWWRDDLEVRSWRYAPVARAPVQVRMSNIRIFLERHALRLALIALLVCIAVPAIALTIAYHLGVFQALVASWAAA
jgi:hypothetical protein